MHVALHGVAEDGGVAVAVALEHVDEIDTHICQFVDFAGHVLNQHGSTSRALRADLRYESFAHVPEDLRLFGFVAEGEPR